MSKISLSDLAQRLAEKSGISLQDAELFIRTMFDVANEGLQSDVSISNIIPDITLLLLSLYHFSVEIKLLALGNLHIVEATHAQTLLSCLDQHFRIHLWRAEFGSSYIVITLLAVDNHLQYLAHFLSRLAIHRTTPRRWCAR